MTTMRVPATTTSALDEVLELAHVARPVVAREALHDVQREPGDRAALARVHLAAEVLGQRRDVLAPLPQGRDLDRNDVEAVVEVLAEVARRRPSPRGRGGWPRRRARRRESARRRRPASPRAPAARAAAWPARCAASRRSRRGTASRRAPPTMRPVRALSAPVKAPRTWPNSSASASASGMAAMLTATNGPSGGALAPWMQPRDDLLAGAGLAADEHAGVGVGDLVDAIQHQPHGRVLADDGHAGGVAAAARRAWPAVTRAIASLEGRGVERLRDHVGGARAQRLDRAGDRAVRRQRQRGDRRAGRRAPS